MVNSWQGLLFEGAEADGLRLRRAREEDLSPILDMLLHPTTLEAVGKTAEQAEQALRQVWQEQSDDSTLRHFIAEEAGAGHMLAYLRLEYPLFEPDCLWLLLLVVNLTHRGQGWGRKIIKFLKTQAQASPGPRKFGLNTLATNVPATRLYESTGFTCLKREPWTRWDGIPTERLTFLVSFDAGAPGLAPEPD